MVISGDKTKLLIFGTYSNRNSKLVSKGIHINIEIGEDVVTESNSEKLLGIIMNNNLSWKSHLEGDTDNIGLLKQLSKRIGILKKIRTYMPTKKFVIAVNSIFISKLIYGITVWGGLWGLANQQNNPRNHMSISKNNMRKLKILENKHKT